MSQLQPILVAGAWRQAEAVDQFTAINPRTRQPLEARFRVSGRADLLAAIAAGAAVAPELAAAAPGTIANFLEAYASLIDANRGELAALAHAVSLEAPGFRWRLSRTFPYRMTLVGARGTREDGP